MSSPPTRAPRRDAAENREAILLAAAVALNDDIDASLETIAARAGLSRRAVYGHFATRDDLLVEIFTRGAARLGRRCSTRCRTPMPAVEIALFGATLWAEVEHVRVSAALAVRGPHRELVGAALDPARERLRETVRRGIADGHIRTDLDSETVARLIENAAVSVLDEATRAAAHSRGDGHRLVMLAGPGRRRHGLARGRRADRIDPRAGVRRDRRSRDRRRTAMKIVLDQVAKGAATPPAHLRHASRPAGDARARRDGAAPDGARPDRLRADASRRRHRHDRRRHRLSAPCASASP